MGRRILREVRFDFRGGRNTAVSPDMLNKTEMVDCTNARLGTDSLGAIEKRTGNKRISTTAIGTSNKVLGLTQWVSPSGKQIVAIANGRLYHKLTDFGDFTEVIPPGGSEFSTTLGAHFAPFRANTTGAPLVLFIASGGKYYKWDGTTLTRIDGVSSAPQANLAVPYHTRIFAVDQRFLKNLSWSKVGDAENWTAGLATNGGSATVDVLTGDTVNALEAVGNSLLVCMKDAIAKFSGYSSDDIQIAQDTSGISSEVGVVGEFALQRIEQVVAFVSDRGPYFATEAGVIPVGLDVEPDFYGIDRTNITKVVVGHHRQRKEVWFALPGLSDGGLNKTVFIYNYRLQNWCGPFLYSFGISTFSRFEDSTGTEWIMAGCNDGFVRHMDLGAKDDVLANGTGGSTYTMTVELAPAFFSTGPGITKALKRMHLQADLPATSALVLKHAFDRNALISEPALTPVDTGTQEYRLDLQNQGKRLRLQFVDASADIPIVNGFVLEAYDMGRP